MNEIIRGVRVPDKFGYPMVGSGRVLIIPRNNRVPAMIGYPAATSDTRINRILVAAPDIRINRLCEANRAFGVIGYLLQLSGNS